MFLVLGHHFSFLAVPHGVRDNRGLFFLEEVLLQAIAQRSVLVWGAAAWSRRWLCFSRLCTQLYIHGNHGSWRLLFLLICLLVCLSSFFVVWFFDMVVLTGALSRRIPLMDRAHFMALW